VADSAAVWLDKYHVAVSGCAYYDFDLFCEALTWRPNVQLVVDADPERILRYGQRGYQATWGGVLMDTQRGVVEDCPGEISSRSSRPTSGGSSSPIGARPYLGHGLEHYQKYGKPRTRKSSTSVPAYLFKGLSRARSFYLYKLQQDRTKVILTRCVQEYAARLEQDEG
jgi:hypothetical protein